MHRRSRWAALGDHEQGVAEVELLSAVDGHCEAIAEHFRATAEEGANLFRWTGGPKDVEGKKIGRPVRIPAGERENLTLS